MINPEAGGSKRGNQLERLKTLINASMPEARIELLTGKEHVQDQARAACKTGADVLAVAGGDGTINEVVQVLVGTKVALGIIPFGTLNHFARALMIPPQLDAAVALLANGNARPVDVGQVNERYFVNNASLGLYPQLVELREHQAHVTSRPVRWGKALWRLMRTAKPIKLGLQGHERTLEEELWLLFVGNNQYRLDPFAPGQRPHLDQHMLDVVLVGSGRRMRLLSLFLALAAARWQDQPLARLATAEFDVELLDDSSCVVAFDGEALEMHSPIRFRSLKDDLHVIAPTTPEVLAK
ncbi:MAG: hypothetical protein NVS4B8_18690 [Herpetosiphon sp.]